jgi:two-component system chemotaxis response regulator CheB
MTDDAFTAQPLADRIDAVVIGTSAGGLEALNALLPRMTAELSLPVAVVIHLPPREPSLLARIFEEKCKLPVHEVEDKDPIEANTVYFGPPNYHLLCETRTQFSLSADDLVNFSRPSIDVLFESARDVFGPRLMGVLLTGANSDGAAGMRAIHDVGGLTVVQDPATASSPQMPLAAIGRSKPDLVLPLEGIAALFETARVPRALGGPA